MALFTLRAAEEVRRAQFANPEGDLDADMVAIAGAIINKRSGIFDPRTYRDRYQEALRELIEAKMKGLTVKPKEITAPPVASVRPQARGVWRAPGVLGRKGTSGRRYGGAC